MALDAIPTYPSEYDSTGVSNNPPGSDSRKQGDDQIRILKANINQAWANVSGAVTASHEEINRLDGISLTDPIITLASGTKQIFYQDTAPTGWTIDATVDERSVRLTKGLAATGIQGGTSGGTNDFGDQFQAHAEGAALGVGGHSLTEEELANHEHRLRGGEAGKGNNAAMQNGNVNSLRGDDASLSNTYLTDVGGDGGDLMETTGSGTAHSHTIDMALKWAACIVATKD